MKKVYNIYADLGSSEDFMGISFYNEKDAKEFCEMFVSSSNLRDDKVFTGKLFYVESYQYDNLVDYLSHNKKSVEYLKNRVKYEENHYGIVDEKYNKVVNQIKDTNSKEDNLEM